MGTDKQIKRRYEADQKKGHGLMFAAQSSLLFSSHRFIRALCEIRGSQVFCFLSGVTPQCEQSGLV
jgi:hypothetical protein